MPLKGKQIQDERNDIESEIASLLCLLSPCWARLQWLNVNIPYLFVYLCIRLGTHCCIEWLYLTMTIHPGILVHDNLRCPTIRDIVIPIDRYGYVATVVRNWILYVVFLRWSCFWWWWMWARQNMSGWMIIHERPFYWWLGVAFLTEWPRNRVSKILVIFYFLVSALNLQ